jgi:O-antigen ligase
MTVSATAAGRARTSATDVFAVALGGLLVGYAFIGKGFAYLGVPPLYVGEIVLIFGLATLLRGGCMLAATASLGSIAVLLLVSWIAVAVVQGAFRYGVDAVRDGVVGLYGFYAFAVAAALIERPALIDGIVHYYRRFATAYVVVPPVAMIFTSSVAASFPVWPNSAQQPLISLRAGEIAIHLAGVVAFTLVGFRNPGRLWTAMLVISTGIVFALNRGGMLAFALPAILAATLARNGRQVMGFFGMALLIGGIAAAVGLSVRIDGGRNIDFVQLVANLTSIFGDSTTGNLDGTKEWRLGWWEAIIGYTIHGDYFWFGKGFGANLAVIDGFVVGPGTPPLRSPHNIHMTFLARSGVSGLVLWLAMLAIWFATIFRNIAVARRDGQAAWAGFFIFVACYVLAIVVDASFDVAIEGPMVGIWFWTLIGVGLGSSMVYWSKYPSRSTLRPPVMGRVLLLIATLTPLLLSSAAFAQEQDDAARPHVLTNRNGPCLSIKDVADVTIENMRIGPCGGHGIDIFGSRRIIVRNVSIERTGGSGIFVLRSENVTVENNVIEDNITSVSAQDSQGVTVRCNRLRNPRGPIPRGQFVQFDKVYGPGNVISCNAGVNEPGRGVPEDAISIYKSSGTAESPILIERNSITGGGPSPSGGGILLGDAGGSYLIARDNILENPGQYGIGVAGEHDIEVSGNIVVARRQPFTNVGISVWRQDPPECRNIVVKNNLVSWISGRGFPNPWWKGPGYCHRVEGVITNNFAAMPEQIAHRKAEIRCGC